MAAASAIDFNGKLTSTLTTGAQHRLIARIRHLHLYLLVCGLPARVRPAIELERCPCVGCSSSNCSCSPSYPDKMARKKKQSTNTKSNSVTAAQGSFKGASTGDANAASSERSASSTPASACATVIERLNNKTIDRYGIPPYAPASACHT